MKRICCECGKVYGEKPGEGDTHGYCPECEDTVRKNLGLAPRKQEKKNRPALALLLEQASAEIEAAIEIIDQVIIESPSSSLIKAKSEARRTQSYIQMHWMDLREQGRLKAWKSA